MVINHTKQQRTRKDCEYSGCDATFIGIKRSKYCEEHRKDKYHNELYHDVYKNQEKLIQKVEKKNQLKLSNIIRHALKKEHTMIFHCDLCQEPFDVIILPRTEVYPKFCQKHRSEYQRELYLLNNKE